MATQADLARQMIAQLRVLDPSVSAEVGTPERKIIDTVAQALAESQIDLNILNGSLDLDAKFGADLDSFLGIFGFGRQQGARATGFVTFSRTTASNFDILVPSGTQVTAHNVGSSLQDVVFRTTFDVTLVKNTLSVLAPVQCIIVGEIGNVAAEAITDFFSAPPSGVTAVTNSQATTGGLSVESDDEFKVRFKNTVFRNMAGTQDQYLALAASTQFTSKANVVGPISRYREYIQVPAVDDASVDPSSSFSGNGTAGEYTTALSTIPYSKYLYATIPYFVTNGKNGLDIVFFRQDTDFYLNATAAAKSRGDTYRQVQLGTGLDPTTDSATLYQPNVTFTNVYTGLEDVPLPKPGNVVYFEHSYTSSASRNDVARNVTNCVDVFIDGGNLTQAEVVIPTPRGGVGTLFSADVNNRFYYKNFRRVNEPLHPPVVNNLFVPLFYQPVIDLPDQITVENATYVKGIHYWAVQDVTGLGGTVRSRNGIEWATQINGQGTGDDSPATPTDALAYTGDTITENPATTVTIQGYVYDANIIDLQAALEGSKQVTTDVLAHRATMRYFKPDITVMYAQGSNPSDVNAAILTALQNFFKNQYFGTTIQLSDVLQVIHNVSGVDNVRWSRELLDNYNSARDLTFGTPDLSGSSRDRIVETDVNGNPLLTILVDRIVQGGPSSTEQQRFYPTGTPTGGTFRIHLGNLVTPPLVYPLDPDPFYLATAIANGIGTYLGVTGGVGITDPPFTYETNANIALDLFTVTSQLTSDTDYIHNSDFFLRDNELPALPSGTIDEDGVVDISSIITIRPRAQNTWAQL